MDRKPVGIDPHGSVNYPKTGVLGKGYHFPVLWGGSCEGWGDILHPPEDSGVGLRERQSDEEQGPLCQG